MADDDYQEGGDPAEAFEALRGEVALVLRAVQGLAAERRELDVPDYSPTLAHIDARLTEVSDRLDTIEQSPALRATPQQLGGQLTAASTEARRADHDALERATSTMNQAARDMRGLAFADRNAREQNRWLYIFGGGGLVLGMMLWAAMPGWVAREIVPASWQWPERMAARTLKEPMWEGGARLMRTASPEGFAAFMASDRIVTANRKALDACRKRANKAREAVRCTIDVEADAR
ncbi:hypothetical protein KZ820_20655 [Sphingomonas sp. RRHST34]|uniref:Uncharacterized protein n=1 Tax=Sphingomonas citri TaxID=2862499 RepID=A0ABS7BU82_9SPHN|nr:DUF6118 family protein [Sphingomonas citri]MBW6533162.1 hypothetical protein [Sphingomonas citri]